MTIHTHLNSDGKSLETIKSLPLYTLKVKLAKPKQNKIL